MVWSRVQWPLRILESAVVYNVSPFCVQAACRSLLLLAVLILSACKPKSLDRADASKSVTDASAVEVPYFDINDGKKHTRRVRRLGVLVGGVPVAWEGARLFRIDADGGVILKCFDMEGPTTVTGIPTTSCIASVDRPEKEPLFGRGKLELHSFRLGPDNKGDCAAMLYSPITNHFMRESWKPQDNGNCYLSDSMVRP